MTETTYVPFSDLQSQPEQLSTITTIEPYSPANAQATTQCNPVFTHCYVCGKGWGYGYWKHCGCNTVPVGDGTLLLAMFLTVYALFKYFKRRKV